MTRSNSAPEVDPGEREQVSNTRNAQSGCDSATGQGHCRAARCCRWLTTRIVGQKLQRSRNRRRRVRDDRTVSQYALRAGSGVESIRAPSEQMGHPYCAWRSRWTLHQAMAKMLFGVAVTGTGSSRQASSAQCGPGRRGLATRCMFPIDGGPPNARIFEWGLRLDGHQTTRAQLRTRSSALRLKPASSADGYTELRFAASRYHQLQRRHCRSRTVSAGSGQRRVPTSSLQDSNS